MLPASPLNIVDNNHNLSHLSHTGSSSASQKLGVHRLQHRSSPQLKDASRSARANITNASASAPRLPGPPTAQTSPTTQASPFERGTQLLAPPGSFAPPQQLPQFVPGLCFNMGGSSSSRSAGILGGSSASSRPSSREGSRGTPSVGLNIPSILTIPGMGGGGHGRNSRPGSAGGGGTGRAASPGLTPILQTNNLLGLAGLGGGGAPNNNLGKPPSGRLRKLSADLTANRPALRTLPVPPTVLQSTTVLAVADPTKHLCEAKTLSETTKDKAASAGNGGRGSSRDEEVVHPADKENSPWKPVQQNKSRSAVGGDGATSGGGLSTRPGGRKQRNSFQKRSPRSHKRGMKELREVIRYRETDLAKR